jgi:hypothetical protein
VTKVHISESGIENDPGGFVTVTCECGIKLGPAPDAETVLDMAMEHAFEAGFRDGQEDVTSVTREHGA